MSKIFTSTLHPLHIFNFPGMRGQEKHPRFFPSIPFAKATWKELVHGDCSESLYFAQSNAPSAFVWRFTSHEPSWGFFQPHEFLNNRDTHGFAWKDPIVLPFFFFF